MYHTQRHYSVHAVLYVDHGTRDISWNHKIEYGLAQLGHRHAGNKWITRSNQIKESNKHDSKNEQEKANLRLRSAAPQRGIPWVGLRTEPLRPSSSFWNERNMKHSATQHQAVNSLKARLCFWKGYGEISLGTVKIIQAASRRCGRGLVLPPQLAGGWRGEAMANIEDITEWSTLEKLKWILPCFSPTAINSTFLPRPINHPMAPSPA